MVQLPSRDDLGPLPSLRTGRQIVSIRTGAEQAGALQLARGLQQAGDTALNIAERRAATAERDAAFSTQSAFLQFEQAQRQKYTQAAESVQPGATGFGSAVVQDYESDARDFFKNIPDPLKREYEGKLLSLQGRLAESADTFEREEQTRYAKVQIGDGQETILGRMTADPSAWQSADQDAEAQINLSPLSPVEKDDAIRTWRKRRAEALFALDDQSDPAGARGRLGIEASGSFVDKVVGAESAGDVNAKNPLSTATGSGQFIESTWRQFIQERHPELLSQGGDIQKYRNDDALSREAVQWYAGKNAVVLQRAGIPVTDGTLYLAHFAGPAGAVKIIQALPAQPIEDILGKGVVSANPFLKGKTAGDVMAWADRKMSGPGTVAPQYEGLPYEERAKLYNDSLASEARATQDAAQQAEADRKLAYTAHKDEMTLGIVQGDIYDEKQIADDPFLDDGDKATLIRSFREQSEKTAQINADTALFASGGLHLNPVDSDDAKRANNLYDSLIKRVPQEAQSLLTGEFIEQTGVVPKKVSASIRYGLTSKDPGTVAASLTDAANIYDRAPGAIDHMDGGTEIRDAAAAYRHLMDDRGFSSEEAAQRIIDMQSDETKRTEAAMKPAADEFVKGLAIGDVTDAFDPGIFSSEPAAGFNAALSETMMADYREIAREKFTGPARGDADIARSMAISEMKSLYGATNINGTSTLMKFPPEKYYPPIDGAYGYLRDEALRDAQSEAQPQTSLDQALAGDMPKKVDVKDIYIQATPQTTDDIRSGRLPRYRLYYATEDEGQLVWHQVLSGGFGFTPDALKERQEASRAATIKGLGPTRERQRQLLQGMEQLRKKPPTPWMIPEGLGGQ